MPEERSYLPVGTLVKLDGQREYIITGEPIGWGGGSILYPAQKRLWKNGAATAEEISHVLKECYPASLGHSFSRNQQGEIIPAMAARRSCAIFGRFRLGKWKRGKSAKGFTAPLPECFPSGIVPSVSN